MKKFMALAAMFAAVMMSFTACGDKDNGAKPGDKDEPDEPEFVAAITIDGDFADWATITPVVATLPTTGTIAKPQIKTLKAYADEFFINFYVEFDSTNIYVIDLLLDTDNDATTGQVDNWTGGADILLQGGIYEWEADKSAQIGPIVWEPSGFSFSGENGTNEWAWEDLGLTAVCTASAPVIIDGTTAAMECAITREMIPVQFADTFGLGMIIETRGWSSVGVAPAISEEDKAEEKTVAMMQVTINK